jgi:tetratricopeptide (TPR) repeat protein
VLRDRLTERERHYVVQRYHSEVTGDVFQWQSALEQFKHTYPRDPVPVLNLGVLYGLIGRHADAVRETRAALDLDPRDRIAYENLTSQYIEADRLFDAKDTIERQRQESVETPAMYRSLYLVARLEQDPATMQRALEWLEDRDRLAFVELQRDIALREGRFGAATRLNEQLVEDHIARGERSAAAQQLVAFARHEALAGHDRKAVVLIRRALALSSSVYVIGRAAFPLALAGSADAEDLISRAAAELGTQTLYTSIRIPLARAALEIRRGRPSAAYGALGAAAPFEFGDVAGYWVSYLRGLALFEQGAFADASAEWQNVLDRRGVDPFSPVWVLSHLQQGRAAARAGDLDLSRRRYQEFLALWTDADDRLGSLRDAREEFERLFGDRA